jgi:hypothetical protein
MSAKAASWGQEAALMSTYRVFFRNGRSIVGRHDFTADNDQVAVTTADILCDACSDRCDSFEVWNGDHRVIGLTLHSPRSADVILGRSQETIVECEEMIQQSEWAIASSEKLLKRLDELRSSDPLRLHEYS